MHVHSFSSFMLGSFVAARGSRVRAGVRGPSCVLCMRARLAAGVVWELVGSTSCETLFESEFDVLLMLYNPHCPGCRALMPHLEKVLQLPTTFLCLPIRALCLRLCFCCSSLSHSHDHSAHIKQQHSQHTNEH